MNRFLKFAPLLLLALAVMLSTTGCKSSQDQTASNTGQASTPDQSQDPAAANLAPCRQLPPLPRPMRPAPSKALRRPIRPPTISRCRTRPRMTTTRTMANSPLTPRPTRRRRCPTTTSPGPRRWLYLDPRLLELRFSRLLLGARRLVQAPYEGALWTPATGVL